MNFLLWIPTILLHELGHWIGFRIFGLKPKIKLINLGIAIQNKNQDELLVWQNIVIYSMGIIFGIFVLILGNADIYDYFIYYVISTVDFAFIFIAIVIGKFNIKTSEIAKYEK